MGKPAVADEFAQIQYEPAECQAELVSSEPAECQGEPAEP